MISTSPTATLRQGILTLSFPDAGAPAFWQLALSDFSLVGFALRSTDKHHELVMTTDADTPRVLAHYTNAAVAQQALAIVLKAVHSRNGCAAGTCTTDAPSRCGGFFRCVLRWTLRLILLGLLLWIGFTLWQIFGTSTPVDPMTDAPVAQSFEAPQAAPQPNTAPPQNGVPLSADDVLGE